MTPNTETTRPELPAPVFQPDGGTYQVISDKLELPRGQYFITLPIPVKSGDLALFAIRENLLVGRWLPDVAGFDCIAIPGILVQIVPEAPTRIVGAVVPCPALRACCAGRIKAWDNPRLS